MRQRVYSILIAALGVSLAGGSFRVVPPANAQGQPFYQGKTIRIVVGFTPGGFYDRWARLLARLYADVHVRQSGNDRSEHARRQLCDCSELCLQRRQR